MVLFYQEDVILKNKMKGKNREMKKDHEGIIFKVASKVAKNAGHDIFLRGSCEEWTDGNSDNLIGAYNYLAKENPQKLTEFMDFLAYWACVGN